MSIYYFKRDPVRVAFFGFILLCLPRKQPRYKRSQIIVKYFNSNLKRKCTFHSFFIAKKAEIWRKSRFSCHRSALERIWKVDKIGNARKLSKTNRKSKSMTGALSSALAVWNLLYFSILCCQPIIYLCGHLSFVESWLPFVLCEFIISVIHSVITFMNL